MKLIILSFVFTFLLACSSNKTSVEVRSSEEFIEKVSKEKFGDSNIEKLFNHSRDFVIIENKIDRGIGFPDVTEFLVVDLKKKKVVYDDSVIDGSVSWNDNDVIQIKRIPDARSKDEEVNEKAELKLINVRNL